MSSNFPTSAAFNVAGEQVAQSTKPVLNGNDVTPCVASSGASKGPEAERERCRLRAERPLPADGAPAPTAKNVECQAVLAAQKLVRRIELDA